MSSELFESDNSFVIIERGITTDYGLFNKHVGNRNVEEKRINKNIARLKLNGWLEFFPMVVNERYEIIDGQGRFEAAKRLGCPIPYVVYKCVKGSDSTLCVDINISNANWKAKDYINYYSEHEGRADYKILKENCDKYEKDLEYHVITALLHGTNNCVNSALIPSGKFVVAKDGQSRLEWFHGLLSRNGMIEYSKKVHGYRRVFNFGLLFAAEKTRCDFESLCVRIKRTPPDTLSATRITDILDSFDDIYNTNRTKNKKIWFTHTYNTLPLEEDEEKDEEELQ